MLMLLTQPLLRRRWAGSRPAGNASRPWAWSSSSQPRMEWLVHYCQVNMVGASTSGAGGWPPLDRVPELD